MLLVLYLVKLLAKSLVFLHKKIIFGKYIGKAVDCIGDLSSAPAKGLYYTAKGGTEQVCLTEYRKDSIKKLFYRQDKLIGCILLGNIQSAGELYEIIKINHLLMS